MRNTILSALGALALLGAVNTADAGSIDFKAGFTSVSVSGIGLQLPKAADDFEALVGNSTSLDIRRTYKKLDVDTSSVTGAEFDGWRNNKGGFAVAGGFTGIEGFATSW